MDTESEESDKEESKLVHFEESSSDSEENAEEEWVEAMTNAKRITLIRGPTED